MFAGASLLMVPLSVTELGQPSPAATLLLASVYTWALAALWIGFLSAIDGGRSPDAQPS